MSENGEARETGQVRRPPADPAIRAALLDMLFKELPRGLVLTVINAALTAYLMRDAAPAPLLAAWLGVMFGVSALRAVVCFAYRRRNKSSLALWHGLFVLGAVASGLAWGSSVALLLHTDSSTHEIFLGFVLAGMAAGAMASLVFDRLAYAAYVLCAVVPYAGLMMLKPGELQLVMGALASLFVVAMLAGGRSFHASIVETLRLRFENEELAGNLRLKAQEQTQTNLLLTAEIERASAAEIQMREAREQALAASRAKSTFLANMSHEIRTPMNGVLGMTELLMRTGLDQQQQELIDRLRSSGTMLLTIIEDVLDLSRIGAGKMSIASEAYNPRECAHDVLMVMSEQATGKGLSLRLRDCDDLPEAVLGDANRVRQVIINLVGNAIKFTSKGSVDIAIARSSGDDGQERLRFAVEDTGIGIAPADLDRMLKPFEQADSSTSRRHGGSGLGLAISSHLVELMGGTLTIRSEPGAGTVVGFDLPLIAVERRQAARQGPSRPMFRDIKVLVAEDNPVNQIIALEYLHSLGCSVDLAADGVQALAACETAHYDLVFMDCQMPELDGYAATRAIRQRESGSHRHMPIVALTANAFEEDRQRSLDAGMDDHLCKPYSADDLADILASWTGPSRNAAGARAAG